MTADRDDITQLSLTTIVTTCIEQTNRFRRTGENDPRACLELFQRALRYASASGGTPRPADPEAQNQLVAIYTPFIHANLNRHAAAWSSETDDLVQQIWLAFWQAAQNGTLTFTTLGQALGYLQEVVRTGAIKQHRRDRETRRAESLDAMTDQSNLHDQRADPFAAVAQRRFAERCRELLPDPIEWRIYTMRYSLVLMPREIAQRLNRDGVQIRNKSLTPRSVSDVLERLMARLAADPEIQALLGE